ncbi:hypothetical protein GCM10009825_21020 [Arthrobacter humicola]|uniref:Uncharacterized protein n=1 Tax=Arthrobacter humicola TaxID=409291 RepID=A0ABP5KR71_9MICC
MADRRKTAGRPVRLADAGPKDHKQDHGDAKERSSSVHQTRIPFPANTYSRAGSGVPPVPVPADGMSRRSINRIDTGPTPRTGPGALSRRVYDVEDVRRQLP